MSSTPNAEQPIVEQDDQADEQAAAEDAAKAAAPKLSDLPSPRSGQVELSYVGKGQWYSPDPPLAGRDYSADEVKTLIRTKQNLAWVLSLRDASGAPLFKFHEVAVTEKDLADEPPPQAAKEKP